MLKSNRFFEFLTFGLFGFIFFHLAKNMLQIRPDGWYVGQVNLYGDLVFHLSLINKFLTANSILIDNPVFAHDKVNYPFLVDLLTAQITRFSSIDFALFITTFLGGLLAIFVSRLFILNFIKNKKVVFLSLLLFFFGGGFGFYYFFHDYLYSQRSPAGFLFSMPNQYTDIKEKGYWFINPILAYFLPQRGFLLAFPLTLTVLLLLYRGVIKDRRFYFIIAGLISGTLPLVQAHSLFLIFLLCLFYAPASIFLKKQKRQLVNSWAIFVFIIILLAFPLFRSISSAPNPTKFIHYAPGWTSEENLIWFWLKNLGIFGPVLVLALSWLFKKNKYFLFLYTPFLLIFFLCNLFIFQPWNFDNSKFLVYWFFASCIVVGYFLYDQFFQENVFKKLIGCTFVFLMIFSSILDIFRTFTLVTNYQIFSKQDLEIAEEIKHLTPKDSVFATASIHNHPIPALTGRSTLVGFNGWLWSHGIDYQKRKNDLAKIYLGDTNAEELISQYQVNYVTIGPLERENFQINEKNFQKYPKINLGNGWEIYHVSNLWSNGNR